MAAQEPPGHWNHTRMHAAAWKGDLKNIKRFLRDGDLIDSFNGRGATPLTAAVVNEQFHAAKTLLEAGANPSLCAHDSLSPLGVAAESDRTSRHQCHLRALWYSVNDRGAEWEREICEALA